MSKIISCDKEHFCDHQIGALSERERIIKLLETEVMRLAETWGDTSWPEWVIALIKGEQE